MQQLKDAIINIHPSNRTILRQETIQNPSCRIVDLYKVNDDVSMGKLLTIIKQIIKKNIQSKHSHLIHYQRVTFLRSEEIPLKNVQPGQYLALIRVNQPLMRKKRILMSLKEKMDYMLAIATAVQSLHTMRRVYLGLNLRQIYTSPNGEIKLGSFYNSEIARVVSNDNMKETFQPKNDEQKRIFDIWCLGVVFIEILINGRLKIVWEDHQRTLSSIKTLIRYTQHIFFYAIRSIIIKMLRDDERQININRVVRKLKRLTRLSEEQLKTSQPIPRQMALSLINKDPMNLPQRQIMALDQRIIIVDAFQLFITLYQQQQLITIELTHPDTNCRVITMQYTYQSLPKNIRSRYKDLVSFFRFLQDLHPSNFSLSKQGSLCLSRL